jgi:hypothetical protein
MHLALLGSKVIISPFPFFFFTEQAHIYCLDPPELEYYQSLNNTHHFLSHHANPKVLSFPPKGTSLSKEGNKEVNEIVPQISGLVSPP